MSDLLTGVSMVIWTNSERTRVIVQDHVKSGKWCIPGGAVEHGETMYEAMQRELYEELGVTALSYRKVADAEAHLPLRPGEEPTKVRQVIVEVILNNPEQMHNKEPQKHRWVGSMSLDELRAKDINNATELFLEAVS